MQSKTFNICSKFALKKSPILLVSIFIVAHYQNIIISGIKKRASEDYNFCEGHKFKEAKLVRNKGTL